MADPLEYQIQYSFAGYQSNSPQKPLPAVPLDNELANIQTAISALVSSVKDVRRSDGGLSNGIVTLEALNESIRTAALSPVSSWAPETSYGAGQVVIQDSSLWSAVEAHTSGDDFDTDEGDGLWDELAELPPGPQGSSGTLSVGTVSTGAAGSNVIIVNVGTPQAAILDITIPRGDVGNEGPASWAAPAAWQTATAYTATAPRSAVVQGGETYVCLVSHTSGTFSTDLSNGNWIKVAAKGADGTGTGDVVGPAASVDGELALFDLTTGKLLKRATTTGLLKAVSGILAPAVAGTDYLANVVEDTTPQLGGTLDTNAKQVRFSKGADVASASTLTLGDDGNYFDITGTTTITSIATKAVGTVVKLHFDGVLIFTHHPTNLVLLGGANITTEAGAEAELVEYATGQWRMTNYARPSGEPLVGGGGDVTTEQLDALQFDNRVQGMHLAEAMGDVLFLGPDGSALHDGFDNLDYVDVAGATNLDTSDAGELKASGGSGGLIPAATGTVIGDYNVRPEAGFDGNYAQAGSASASNTDGASGIERYGKDFGTARPVNGFSIYGSNTVGYINNVGSTVSFTMKASNTDPTTTSWTGDTIGSVGSFSNTSAVNNKSSLDNVNTTPYRYAWIEININTTQSRFVAELEFYEAADDPEGMEVESVAVEAADVPDWIRVALRIEDGDGIVLNTDLMVDVSRDDGTTWTEAVLVERYTQPGDVRVLDTGNVDVTGQPSGSDIKWRIRTENEVIPILSIAMWAGS